MSEVRGAIRIGDVATVPELVVRVNLALERLLGQDQRRFNLEPSRKPVRVLTASGMATAGDMVLLCDATAGPVTVSLPEAAAVKGLWWVVKKTDASANAVTVDPLGSETVDGALTAATTTQYTTIRLVSDGANWHLF